MSVLVAEIAVIAAFTVFFEWQRASTPAEQQPPVEVPLVRQPPVQMALPLLIGAVPTSSRAAAAAPEPRRVTVAASGDLLIHMPVTNQAGAYGEESGQEYDYTPMFDQVAPVLEAADWSVCHLEVPLSPDNSHLSGFPLFSAPWQVADAIDAAGFDACSTASNHSVDQGAAGVSATLDALDAAGVAHAGTARSAEEAAQPRLHQVADVTVAHLSSTFSVGGLPLPEAWMVDLIDAEDIAADAAAARDAGAEVVVASLHWGAEYRREPTTAQRELAERLLEGGHVDLILGHHAHVVQPVERINDRLAVYGLGNFLSNQTDPTATQDGVIIVVELEEVDEAAFEATALSFVPTWVDRDDYTIVDVGSALDDDLSAGRRDLLQASWDRTVEAVTAEGIDEWHAEAISGSALIEQLGE